MLSRGEGRLQVMLKMISHAKLLDFGAEGANADKLWERVKKMSVRGQQAFVDEIDDLHTFVKEFAGGIGRPRNLFYLRDFIRTLKVEREIPGELWAAIAKVAVGQKHAANLPHRCRMNFRCAMASQLRCNVRSAMTSLSAELLHGVCSCTPCTRFAGCGIELVYAACCVDNARSGSSIPQWISLSQNSYGLWTQLDGCTSNDAWNGVVDKRAHFA
jgi:hypothetical protein